MKICPTDEWQTVPNFQQGCKFAHFMIFAFRKVILAFLVIFSFLWFYKKVDKTSNLSCKKTGMNMKWNYPYLLHDKNGKIFAGVKPFAHLMVWGISQVILGIHGHFQFFFECLNDNFSTFLVEYLNSYFFLWPTVMCVPIRFLLVSRIILGFLIPGFKPIDFYWVSIGTRPKKFIN